MKRAIPSRPFSGQAMPQMTREQRLEARTARMANLAEIHRACPPIARGVMTRVVGAAPPIPKEDASQSPAYVAAAKALGYCMNCGHKPTPWAPLQFCHADQGKGVGIKTDVREGWPGCDACHSLLGGHNGGSRLPKHERRTLEKTLARRTRDAIRAAGTWPKNLSDWSER